MNQLPLSVKWHNASENSILSTNDACFHYIGTTLPVKAKPSRVKHTSCRWYGGWDTDWRSVLDVGGSQRELFVCACGACLRWKCVLRLQIIYCWFLLVYHHTYLFLHNYSLWRCWFLGSPSFWDRSKKVYFVSGCGWPRRELFVCICYGRLLWKCVHLCEVAAFGRRQTGKLTPRQPFQMHTRRLLLQHQCVSQSSIVSM